MPALIINPLADEEFTAFAEDCARDAADPAALQTKLRERYPRAVARSRELDGERPIWYVYREGRWVQSPRHDLKATAESIVSDAERLQEIELRKLELEPQETEIHRLASQAEQLAEDIAAKARAEKEIADQLTD